MYNILGQNVAALLTTPRPLIFYHASAGETAPPVSAWGATTKRTSAAVRWPESVQPDYQSALRLAEVSSLALMYPPVWLRSVVPAVCNGFPRSGAARLRASPAWRSPLRQVGDYLSQSLL